LSARSRSGGPAAGTRLVSGPGDPGQQGWGDGQLSHALLSPLVDGLMLPLCLLSAVTHMPYRPNEKPLTGLTHTCTVRCRRQPQDGRLYIQHREVR
jgi:hypothetical protein